MKRLLLIAHVPGTRRRIWGLTKYLPAYGWEVTFLTPSAENQGVAARVVSTPYHDWLRRRVLGLDPEAGAGANIVQQLHQRRSLLSPLFSLAGAFVNYPCYDKKWIPLAVQAGSRLLRDEHFDAIASSYPSAAAHLIAGRLKRASGIPWLADFRDLWSQNHNYAYGRLARARDERLERRTMSTANALVTVSEPLADKLRILHATIPVYAVTNGFDESGVLPTKLTENFTMTYTGTIVGRQDPGRLFEALRNLIDRGLFPPTYQADVKIRYYGASKERLASAASQYGMQTLVFDYGEVPHAAALQAQQESQLLLHIGWDDPLEKGVYAAKIFEYLGARRPILSIGGYSDDVVGNLLSQTAAGVQAPTVQEIERELTRCYQEFKNTGAVQYHGIESELAKYTHREMARQFAEILDNLTGARPVGSSNRN